MRMKIMYKTRSGKEFTYDEIKKLWLSSHPDKTEDEFEWALYFAVEEYKTVEEVRY